MPDRRLTPKRLWFWTIVASLLYLALHVAEDAFLRIHVSTWLFAAVIMAFAVWAGRRQRSLLLILVGLTAGTLAWHFELAMHLDTVFSPRSLVAHLIAFGVLLFFSIPASLLRRKRTRTWQRWLFASAALHAENAESGMPETREPGEPCRVRTASYTRGELTALAGFLAARRIAVPAWEDDTLVLLLPGEQHLFRDDMDRRDEMTCVRFEATGAIRARISDADFRRIGAAAPYDALCRGLGNAVFDLLQRHRQGERDLILREVQDDTREATAILVMVGLLALLFALLLYFDLL